MQPLSFKRHRFPADVIRHAVWLYFRLTLSFRNVEEMLAARSIDGSYGTIRCWTIKFGPQKSVSDRRHRRDDIWTRWSATSAASGCASGERPWREDRAAFTGLMPALI